MSLAIDADRNRTIIKSDREPKALGRLKSNKKSASTDGNERQTFRAIQYLGSKMRLVDQIEKLVADINPRGAVCDLFSGSAVVSHALAARYPVIAVDIQRYSSDIASALLVSKVPPIEIVRRALTGIEKSETWVALMKAFRVLVEKEESALQHAGKGSMSELLAFTDATPFYALMKADKNINPSTHVLKETVQAVKNFRRLSGSVKRHALASSYFGGVYFSHRQSIKIDAIHEMIFKNPELKSFQPILLAALLSAISEAVNTVGKQFAQPMRLVDRNGKAKKLLIERTVRDRSYDISKLFLEWLEKYIRTARAEPKKHKVFEGDYRDFLKSYRGDIACFYADPPYTIDHYSRFYHVLETIARYDFPELADRSRGTQREIMRGLYRKERHQSPFCIPSQAPGAFEEMLEGVSRFNAPLILSYSPYAEKNLDRPRLVTLEALTQLCTKYYKSVEVVEVDGHVHRRLHSTTRNIKKLTNSEVFLVCRKG